MIEVGTDVWIPGAETHGVVDAIMMDVNGIQYRVVFWREGVRRVEWVYPPEISSVNKKSPAEAGPKQ